MNFGKCITPMLINMFRVLFKMILEDRIVDKYGKMEQVFCMKIVIQNKLENSKGYRN